MLEYKRKYADDYDLFKNLGYQSFLNFHLNKLPIIEKTQSERSILEKTLISNAFMRNLNKEQLHKVRITPSCGRISHQCQP